MSNEFASVPWPTSAETAHAALSGGGQHVRATSRDAAHHTPIAGKHSSDSNENSNTNATANASTPAEDNNGAADAALATTLSALLAESGDSLIIATDDGSTVFAHAAHAVRLVPALGAVLVALARIEPHGASGATDHQQLREVLEATIWEFGMEHSSLVATEDVAQPLLQSTAADVMLLIQQVLAGRAATTPAGVAGGVDADMREQARRALEAMPGISLLDAGYGSLVCVAHLSTPPQQHGDARHAAVRTAVQTWLQATSSLGSTTPDV